MVVLQSGWTPQKHRLFLSKQTDSFKQPNLFGPGFSLPRVQRRSPRGEQKHTEFLQREKSLCTQRPEPMICMLEAEPCKARQGFCSGFPKVSSFPYPAVPQDTSSSSKAELIPHRPEIHLISPPLQPANGESKLNPNWISSSSAVSGDCSLLLLSLSGRKPGQTLKEWQTVSGQICPAYLSWVQTEDKLNHIYLLLLLVRPSFPLCLAGECHPVLYRTTPNEESWVE